MNHNGDVDLAKQLIDVAADAGADAVKFQKRTPDISTPASMRDTLRETPWGTMTYLDYRYRVEFDRDQYIEVADHALLRGLEWFASPWDAPSVLFLEDLNVVAHKIASACVTDIPLLEAVRDTGKPVILSTGMSTMEQIDAAIEVLGTDRLVLMHATSTYPMEPERSEPAGDPGAPRPLPGCARSATPDTSAACRSRWPPSRSAPSRWSATSPSTGPCGAPITPPRSSRQVCSTSSATSASSRRRSATA